MVLNTALLEHEASLRLIRVGMVGAGVTGRGIALQLATPAPGVRLAAICNRTPEHGTRAFCEAGITDWKFAETAREAKTGGPCLQLPRRFITSLTSAIQATAGSYFIFASSFRSAI